MANVKAVLDQRAAKKDGTFPVKICLTHRNKSALINTGLSVQKNQWNVSSGMLSPIWIADHPSSKKYNTIILTKLLYFQNSINNLDLEGKINRLSITELRDVLENKDQPEEPGKQEPKEKIYTLAEHFDKYIARIKNARTKEIYQETLTKIKKFDPAVTFQGATISWLKDFDSDMADSCEMNTRAIHMRNIRAVFNDAIDEELTSLYPFRKFKIKKEETRKRALTIEQLRLIRDYPVQEHQQKYRDLFMLSFYLIGINTVDLLALKHADYVNGRIEYKRAKTGTLYSIQVLPEAAKIIERYKGVNYLLDVMDHYQNYRDFIHRINGNLKEIGSLEWVTNKAKDPKYTKKNVKKITPLFPELTTYWARHTWVTIAGGLEIPIETISMALGHKLGSKTTWIYYDFNLKKIDEANKKVLEAIR